MAMNVSPTIVEPTTSSDSPLPSIPSLSPLPSSSSDSFDSSRPNSQGSSATSRSASSSPSPIPKSNSAIDIQDSVELPALPSNPPLPENAATSQSHHQDDHPRSVPPAAALNLRTNDEASWLSRLRSLIPKRNWFGNALGTISLGLTLIGMIIFGERTYKLAVWSAWNDTLDTCGQLNSTGITLGPNCKKLLLNNTADVTFPPYSHWKRAWDAAGYRLLKDSFTERSALSTSRLGDGAVYISFTSFSSVATVLASTVIIGGLSLIIFRRYWRTEEVFTSPVRSDWQFTRHHQEGPETVSGDGYRIIWRNPEDDHPLGQLRQRIRSSQPNAVENPTGEPTWQPHNTSEDTLVGPWKDTKWATSKVSLTNDASDEKHENLIELETEGPNKTFFDPETGEFIHLTPWKSTGCEDIHGLKPDGKGSTKRALAQMTLGGTGWAGGKNIDDQLAEELQANSKGGGKKESAQHRAGDCITGHMANEVPSGKPTMDPIAAANEKDTDEVDPKVTEFLLQKPWYARMKHDTDADADVDADSYVEGAEPKDNSASALDPDKEQEDAGIWIPQVAPDGRLFYLNTLTGASRADLPPYKCSLSDCIPDWETNPIDSSRLPFADREDTMSDFEAVIRELARIDGDEAGDIDATLAKLEGQHPKSQIGFSEREPATKPNVEEQWQAILAKTERKKATELYSGRSSSYSDDDSINVRRAKQAQAVHAEMQKFKLLADHVRVEATFEAKRDRWQKLRSVVRRFGRQRSKNVTTPSKEGFEREFVTNNFGSSLPTATSSDQFMIEAITDSQVDTQGAEVADYA